MVFTYIGPGVGIGGLVLVGIILLIVLASVGFILWIPLKKFFRKVTAIFRK